MAMRFDKFTLKGQEAIAEAQDVAANHEQQEVDRVGAVGPRGVGRGRA